MATGRVPTTANSPLTTKGDIFGYSTTSARVAVGNDGDTLLADSSQTTGLRWQAQFVAGRNKIINGAFDWNQRGFTSNTTNASYNFDRWLQQNAGGTYTVTPQTFTLGSAPVAGYEGTNFLQAVSASQSAAGDVGVITQRIEDVRTLANQTVVVSFWAKANTGTPKIGIELAQNFGSGGSPSAQVSTPVGAVTLSTSWARYSASVALPSIAGKTLGSTAGTSYLELNLWTSAGSTFATRASSIGIQNFTASIWGVQVEAGSVATAFTTATGTLQGELAACQRYYWRSTAVGAYTVFTGAGIGRSTTVADVPLKLPVSMRTRPTALETSNLQLADTVNGYTTGTFTMDTSQSNTDSVLLQYTHGSAALTQFRGYFITANNNTSAYIGVTAEL